MIRLRVSSSKSWASTDGARRNGAVLFAALRERGFTRGSRFITLTYRREGWDDAYDLYKRSGEERHVRRFIERLGNAIGQNLTGRWLCKLEFQRGGWVHWHIIIDGCGDIPYELLRETWGFGGVYIQRCSKSTLKYMCKYISKDGELPAFVLLEPVRSLKIIRVSPGFWGDSKDTGEARSRCDSIERRPKLSAWRSIGQAVEDAEEATEVMDEDTGRVVVVKRPIWDIWRSLSTRGRIVGSDGRWVRVTGVTMDDAARVPGGGVGRRPGPRGRSPRGRPGLTLTDPPNPPKWLDRYMFWKLGGEAW